MTTTAKTKLFAAQPRVPPCSGRCSSLNAGLLVASGIIHFHLWQIAYRDVPTFRYLFLIQAIGAVLAGLVLLATRQLLIVIGCALLMAGTIVGFITVREGTLFGFHLPFISGLAWTVLIVEAAAIVMLAVTACLPRGLAVVAIGRLAQPDAVTSCQRPPFNATLLPLA